MNKTIKELAEELEVSKQTIQKIIEKLPNEDKPFKKGNKYILSSNNQKRIKEFLGINLDIKSDKSNIEMDNLDKEINKSDKESDIIDNKTDKLDINGYIDFLSNQLTSKDKQIDKLQKLLDQQQVLTLQANKKIEQLELKEEQTFEDDQNKQRTDSDYATSSEDKKSFWTRFFKS